MQSKLKDKLILAFNNEASRKFVKGLTLCHSGLHQNLQYHIIFIRACVQVQAAQTPANTSGKQQKTVQVPGPYHPPICKIQMEFWTPRLGPGPTLAVVVI